MCVCVSRRKIVDKFKHKAPTCRQRQSAGTTRGVQILITKKIKKRSLHVTQRKIVDANSFEYKAPYANCQRDSRPKETSKRADAWKLVKLPEPRQFPGRRKICANSTIGSSCLLRCKSVSGSAGRSRNVARYVQRMYVRSHTDERRNTWRFYVTRSVSTDAMGHPYTEEYYCH